MPRSGSTLARHSRRRRRMISAMSEYANEYESVDPSPYLDEPLEFAPVSDDAVATAAINPFAEEDTDELEENELEVVESISAKELFGEINDGVTPASGDVQEDDIQWGEKHRLGEEYDAADDQAESVDIRPVAVNPFEDDSFDEEESESIAPFTDEHLGLNEIRQLLHVERPSMWMFLGDEITLGSRRHVNVKSYVDIFAERVRDEMRRMQDSVVNAGIPGRTATLTLHELQHRLRLNPTVVGLQFGLHDVREKEWSPDRFRIQLLTIVDQIRLGNAIPFLQSPPQMKLSNKSSWKRFHALNTVIRNLAEEEEVPLIDHAAFHEEHDINGLTVNPENGFLVTKHHSDARMAFLLFQELDIFDKQSDLCKHVSNLI